MRRDSASQDCHVPSCVTSDETQPSLSSGDLIRNMHILTPALCRQREELVRSAGHRPCWATAGFLPALGSFWEGTEQSVPLFGSFLLLLTSHPGGTRI